MKKNSTAPRAKTEQIGNVTLHYLKDKQDTRYSDGLVEDELLALFKSEDAAQKRQALLADTPAWEYIYHLSPQRGAVVNWYSFEPGASVLEIGAGCGAITEELVKKPVRVTALELTQMRSRINAHRNKQADNLNIVVGNLSDYRPAEKFDYIVCVGVLEYAGTFIDSDRPYDEFLSLLRSLLKPGGRLIVAIENRFGLKYWAGAKEDHTGDFFDGLNGYPNKAVQTFGRVELETRVLDNGFKKADFYYPYPDYKHPRVVYSDDYYPGNGAEFPLNTLPTPVPGQSRVHLFSESLTMLSLEKNKLFPHFANSFIVVAER